MLGPIETDNTELRQQSLIQKPTDLFSCGIIFPKGYTGDPEKNVDRHQNLASEQGDEVSEIDEIPENNSINPAKNKGFVEEDYVDPKDDGEIPDDIINTTEKNQATFGLSFRSQEKSELEISLYFGTYHPVSTEIEGKKQTEYKRSENLYKVALTAEKSNGLRKIKSISKDLSLIMLLATI